jgi:DNA (cytosine-5)-methyltransferase 1
MEKSMDGSLRSPTRSASPRRILDLFCCAGGAAMGLHRAWPDAEIVGVDINPQPRYPFRFVQADAMTCPLDGFDFIWASPPCQGYSLSRNNGSGKDAPKLVEAVRGCLQASGRPYIIENVQGAPLRAAAMLCGASFGLGAAGLDLNRHRYFETSFAVLAPPCQHRRGKTLGVYGNGTNSWHREKLGRCITVAEMREAMGIDWMVRRELSQAIPPAYSEYIARQFQGAENGA